ncbi:MmgE/PrpD family protein [Streptomyces sp. NBC_00988]|uniref:MmgE/PrpD family protein n=1 Tax=Streptomyces sp. NBC_00988 TaxID=2903704 RepID=UPI00386A06DF|nr:MmgE/PrpD family protein [Streptomyces sp. NBC_00988]
MTGPDGNRPVAMELGRFVAGLGPDDIPPGALARCKQLILDTIGVGVAGSHDPVAGILDRWLDLQGAHDGSVVLGGRRAPAHDAAFANGTLMHILEFDDMRWPGHGSSSVVPTALALGERQRCGGPELLAAVIAGLEIFGTLSAHKGKPVDPSWHSTSVCALLAAPAAGARTLGLNATRTAHALALGAESGAGTTATLGSMALGMHAGHAAAAGVRSTELAASGAVANLGSVGGTDGFAAAYFGGTVDWDGFLGALGNPFLLESGGPTIRPYACGGPNQLAVASLETILRRDRLTEPDVAGIEVHLDPKILRLSRFDWPSSRYEAKLSMRYNLAATLLGRPPDVGLSESESFADPVFRAVGERIVVVPDRPGRVDRAEVVVTTVGGARFAEEQRVLHGSPQDPLEDAEVVAKFRSCVARDVPEEDVERLCSVVLGLEKDTAGDFWPAWQAVAAAATNTG